MCMKLVWNIWCSIMYKLFWLDMVITFLGEKEKALKRVAEQSQHIFVYPSFPSSFHFIERGIQSVHLSKHYLCNFRF